MVYADYSMDESVLDAPVGCYDAGAVHASVLAVGVVLRGTGEDEDKGRKVMTVSKLRAYAVDHNNRDMGYLDDFDFRAGIALRGMSERRMRLIHNSRDSEPLQSHGAIGWQDYSEIRQSELDFIKQMEAMIRVEGKSDAEFYDVEDGETPYGGKQCNFRIDFDNLY